MAPSQRHPQNIQSSSTKNFVIKCGGCVAIRRERTQRTAFSRPVVDWTRRRFDDTIQSHIGAHWSTHQLIVYLNDGVNCNGVFSLIKICCRIKKEEESSKQQQKNEGNEGNGLTVNVDDGTAADRRRYPIGCD